MPKTQGGKYNTREEYNKSPTHSVHSSPYQIWRNDAADVSLCVCRCDAHSGALCCAPILLLLYVPAVPMTYLPTLSAAASSYLGSMRINIYLDSIYDVGVCVNQIASQKSSET